MKPHETIILEINRERERQVEKEGWSVEHDDQHVDGSLAIAAAAYALPQKALVARAEYEYPGRGEYDRQVVYKIPTLWLRSWHAKWWKPKDRRRDLIRAAALLVAEIERIDRQVSSKAG